MQINFNPRVTSSFADLIMKTDRVKAVLHEIDSEEERRNIVKEILISGFTRYKIDINDLINYLKEDQQ